MGKIIAYESNEIQYSRPHIVVGVGSAHSELRVSVLLNVLPDYQMDVIHSDCDINAYIQDANIVIGSQQVALNGILHKKPVVVIGEYGSGGLLTSENVLAQYHNNFSGRIGGTHEEYFPLEQLQHDIEKAFTVSTQELDFMYNCIKDLVMRK